LAQFKDQRDRLGRRVRKAIRGQAAYKGLLGLLELLVRKVRSELPAQRDQPAQPAQPALLDRKATRVWRDHQDPRD